jgi:RNA recognition motif-containing protein
MKKHTRPSHDSSEESDDGHQLKKGGSKHAPAKKVVHDSSDSEAEAHDNRRKNNNSDSESDEKPRAATTANRTAVSDGADEDNKEIFIKSLSYDVDESDLGDIFGKYGTMSKCKLV